MATTKLIDLINPEVMADMIVEKLPAMIAVSPFATIDTTLQGQPGDTITVPSYEYIGDAEVVAEGVEMGTTKLKTTTQKTTVYKIGKSIDITDEAMLSGYGNPIGSATSQLTKSISQKIDADAIDKLSAVSTLVYEGTKAISYEGMVDAVDLFVEETQLPKVVFIHPFQVTTLRKDPSFLDINKYPITNGVIMTGTIGQIAGCQIVPSRRVKLEGGKYINPIIKLGNTVTDEDLPALTIYLKRNVMIETERKAKAGISSIVANEHYAVAATNSEKIVVAKFTATATEQAKYAKMVKVMKAKEEEKEEAEKEEAENYEA